LGSGSGKVCDIAAQVVGLFGACALNYMIVSDAGKPFEMDDRANESGALVLKASLGRSRENCPGDVRREDPIAFGGHVSKVTGNVVGEQRIVGQFPDRLAKDAFVIDEHDVARIVK
jgi:hypothetical protein